MSTDFYRLNTVYSLKKLPKYPHQHAGRTQKKREREGDGEEDILVGGVGVEVFVVEHHAHTYAEFSLFSDPHDYLFYRRNTDYDS